jgi:polynucleotide 5'-kinase involved in rRNA processing
VAYLDTDVGQTEFTGPGCIFLITEQLVRRLQSLASTVAYAVYM